MKRLLRERVSCPVLSKGVVAVNFEGRSGTGLIGRESALTVLRRHGATARTGSARAVLLRGPRGTGKSALLNRVAMIEIEHGTTVLTAEGRGENTDLTVARRLLAPAGITVPEAPEAPAELFSVFRSLWQRVADLTEEAPLCLLLDDLDACDLATVRWIDFLMRRMPDRPISVVLTRGTEPASRPMDRVIANLLAMWCTDVIDLEPLNRDEVVEMVTATLGASPDPVFVDTCHRLSGGNPGHLTNLLENLSGIEPDDTGLLRISAFPRDAVAAVVRARMLEQPDQVRAVAAAVVVLGRMNPEFVGPLAGVASRVALESVDTLQREHLLGHGLPHPLRDWFRDCLEDVFDPAHLAALRMRAALLLDEGGRSVEDVARQLVQLERIDETWMSHVLIEAAATVSARGAPEAAARYLERLVERDPDNVEVRIGLATQLSRKDPVSASEHLAAAFHHTKDPALRAGLAVKFALTARDWTMARDARDLLDAARRDLDTAGLDRPADLRALLDASGLALDLGHSATAAEAVARARALEPPRGDTTAERCLLGVLSEATMRGGGSLGRALDQARRAVSDDLTLTDWSMLSAATVLRCSGEPAEALAVLDRAVEAFTLNGDELARCRTLTQRATVLMSMGDLFRAEQDAHDAVLVVQDGSWQHEVPRPSVALAWIACQLGQVERAEKLIGPLDVTDVGHRVSEHREYLRVSGWIAFLRDDLDSALDYLVRCGRVMRETGLNDPSAVPLWVDLAFMATLCGREREALDAARAAEDLAQSWNSAETLAFSQLARGYVTTGPNAADLAAAASRNFGSVPALIQQTRAEVLLGRLWLGMGDEKTARAHLRTAVGLALRCGHRPLADEARELLLGAGGRMRIPEQAERVDLVGLTPSERRVAELAAAGASNRQIAERLFVALRTVEVHLTRVYRKLGVARRADLSEAIALRRSPAGTRP
ncbi:LuxR family transcriptional regulator [Lentzea sp. NBRC 105346]|uniref:helix-turn-helix transcriptional regulator n=1 Tax=Lentzea sp. NBRC 105346 TaxID=3032205 RepID=UPI002556494A|nr:LuxR family transcriptional regulator [Lentzea sp. NBRC 105346]